MKARTATDLKPSKNEISHIQTLTSDKMIQDWSVYISDGNYNLVKGKLFNERQNHTVFMSDKNYNKIASYLLKSQC